MNKIYKVMYSKVKQCCVVVSEIAKSHGRHTKRSVAKSSAALTAGVLIALGSFSFEGMPVVQAADGTESLKNNDYVGANGYYWYFDEKTNQWTKYPYKISSLNNNRSWQELPNYEGGGAKEPGAVTAGLYAQAGEQTVTIGNRNAGQSKGSVFIGELDGYNDGGKNDPVGMKNNYVTAVGFQSNATGWGSIAIGSNAVAENTRETSQVVDYDGNKGTSGTVQDDNYGIKLNPPITWSSVALGYNAKAKDGNIAIGANSDATSTDKGDSYVSVGNGTLKRRITNVAKGTDNSDVVTVGQMNDAIAQTGGSVKAGWGITKSNDNTISVKHNLSTGDSAYAAVAYADSEATGLILGGSIQDRNADEKYGATTETSVIVGARNALASNDNTVVIGGDNNIASRRGSTVVGGSSNTASGQGYSEAASVFGGSFNISNGLASVVLGGVGNVANNEYSTNSGGAKNVVFGLGSNNSGGLKNVVYASDNASSFGGVAAAVNGQYSTGVAGGSTGSNARLSFAAGFQSLVTDSGVRKTVITRDEYERKWSEQTREFGPVQAGFNPITNKYEQDDKISTALGYQATADEPGTIAFGHDAGDESGYTYEWETLTDEKGNPKQNEIDGTTNDYTKAPKSVKKKAPYTSAYYNRLVKAADGIEDHDAVVMEQLKNASDVGSKIKVYQTDENGNIKFDKNNNPIEDTSDSDAVKTKREAAQKASEDAWGKAIGTGKIADPTKSDTNDPEANGSQQLVTGGTVYDALQKQKTELTDSLSVNAGWGIDIDKAKKNTISVKHNLGTGYADTDATGLILGGSLQNRDAAKEYGTATASSVIVGAQNALASNDNSVVVGGLDNVASGATSVVIGGDYNNAAGNQSAVFGGRDNKAAGVASTASGGIMNAAVGQQATAIGGSLNYVLGANATAVGGLGRDYANGEVVYDSAVRGGSSVGIAGGSTGENAIGALAAGHQAVVTTENGTAIGYQATTDEANTIAFGHDAGDVSGYTIKWKQLPPNQINADGTTNDYTQAPESVTENKYTTAAYNRLVKVADGQDDHDVVVMEQLKQYAEKDASNLGNNIKVYKTDEKGNVQLDKDKNPVEDTGATTTAQKNSKDDWGKALGAGTLTAATAKDSDQLVTGKTLYDYDKPTGSTNYVNANNTTGQNLSALDAQVKSNAKTLNDKTHNIKYYSVTKGFKLGDYRTNENNDGATDAALAGMAAGYETGTTGIASTVAGSYSGVIGSDLQGAAAVSVGTVNVNKNTNPNKAFSGVANSIVGQANMTTDSNAAIIVGAGNSVTNSYRDLDTTTDTLSNIKRAVASKDANALKKALQDAVPKSGAQVMVMGGGNSVDKAYMTQVVGVGNTVMGSTSEYNENTSNTSTQLNYVDGFYNTIEIGKNNYVIGSHNTLTGSSVDTNKSNLVLGDNHKLTNQKNNVILGSADNEQETKASEAVVIGHNADVSVNGGVAIGSGSVSVATDTADAEGYDPASTAANKASKDTSTTWKATTGAVSIGGVNGNTTTTRRITNLAAGFNDTDAVNVAQIKKLASINASNIGANLQYGADGTTAVTDTDKTKNKEAWATAIGTGTVTKDDDGSKQMVTGKTVYDALHGGLDNITVGKDGQNGKDGSIGIAGQNGKDGYSITYIKTEQGAAGVDGKDGITRVVYQDKDGNGKHTFATLDDGLKFKGDDSTVIAKKLNEQLNITGGAGSTNLTDKNIGVNSSTDGLKIQLAKNLTSITSISGSTDTNGAKITLYENDKNISVNGGSIKDVASNLTKDGKIINGSDKNAASISDVQTLVQQGVDNGYTHGDGITIQKDGTSGKNVISVNQGDGLKFDNGKLAVNTGDGLTVDETTKALKIKTSDSNLKVDRNGIGLNNVITIGTAGTNAHPITIDGTKGEVSGLNNTSWDSTANYSNSTKAATESQVAAAVKDAIKQAGDNDVDTHVNADSYGVDANHQVSMDIVDKNGKATGKKVTITDVATHTEVGDVTKLDRGVQNASGTTSVVDAINNVNTSMNTKIGDQNYSKSNTSGTNKYVSDGDSITSAIGKLDGAVQQAASAAGKHSTVSEGSNIKVNGNVQNDGHMDYKVSLKDDISLNSVTTDTLTVNNSATIGGVTIANKTISGLDDTKIEKGSTNAVNAGTIWNELRPSGGTYINQNNTTAQNITNLDTQVKKNSDLVNSDGSTIKIGSKDSATKVDISDKNGSGRVVTGVVTDAADPTSAANVGYVNGVTAANTQQIYRDMNNAYGRLNNNINKAAAGSNALAALHPLDYDPDDKADFAVGYGHYRNANAAAVGAFYHPNENTMVNVGVSLGNGDPGFNAGVSFKVGRGGAGREAMSKTEMAKVINSQSKEIDALKKDNADKDKRIDALEQKMAEILAKLDKNGK